MEGDGKPITFARSYDFDVLKVQRICQGLETGFRAAWPDFPCGCCIESSEVVHAVLGRSYIGTSVMTRRGSYCGRGHQWVETEDGTIIDPTLGQFVGGPALHIIGTDHELYPNFKADTTAVAF